MKVVLAALIILVIPLTLLQLSNKEVPKLHALNKEKLKILVAEKLVALIQKNSVKLIMNIVQISVVPEENVSEVNASVLLDGLEKIAPKSLHAKMIVTPMVNAKRTDLANVTKAGLEMVVPYVVEMLAINAQMIVVAMDNVIKEYVPVMQAGK